LSEAAAANSFNASLISGLSELDKLDEELGFKPLKINPGDFAQLTESS
jgi:hypothetical protein